MRDDGVVILPVVLARADMHCDVDQLRDGVQQPVVGRVGDCVRVDDAQLAVDDDAGLGADPVDHDEFVPGEPTRSRRRPLTARSLRR